MRISAVRIFFLETWYVVIVSIFSFFLNIKHHRILPEQETQTNKQIKGKNDNKIPQINQNNLFNQSDNQSCIAVWHIYETTSSNFTGMYANKPKVVSLIFREYKNSRDSVHQLISFISRAAQLLHVLTSVGCKILINLMAVISFIQNQRQLLNLVTLCFMASKLRLRILFCCS